jgi:hypothetical protein
MRTNVTTLRVVNNGQAQDVVVIGLSLSIQLMVETTVIPVVMVIMLPVLVVSHPDMVGMAGLAIKADPKNIVTQTMLNGERMSTTAAQDYVLEQKV